LYAGPDPDNLYIADHTSKKCDPCSLSIFNISLGHALGLVIRKGDRETHKPHMQINNEFCCVIKMRNSFAIKPAAIQKNEQEQSNEMSTCMQSIIFCLIHRILHATARNSTIAENKLLSIQALAVHC